MDHMFVANRRNRVGTRNLVKELDKLNRAEKCDLRMLQTAKRRFHAKFMKYETPSTSPSSTGSDASNVRMYETHYPGFCFHRNGEHRCSAKKPDIPPAETFEAVRELLFTGDEVDVEKVLCLHLLAAHRIAPSSCCSSPCRSRLPSLRLPTYVLETTSTGYAEEDEDMLLDADGSPTDSTTPSVTSVPLYVNDQVECLIESVLEVLLKVNPEKVHEMMEIAHDPSALLSLLEKPETQDFFDSLYGKLFLSSYDYFHVSCCKKLVANGDPVVGDDNEMTAVSLDVPDSAHGVERLLEHIRKSVMTEVKVRQDLREAREARDARVKELLRTARRKSSGGSFRSTPHSSVMTPSADSSVSPSPGRRASRQSDTTTSPRGSTAQRESSQQEADTKNTTNSPPSSRRSSRRSSSLKPWPETPNRSRDRSASPMNLFSSSTLATGFGTMTPSKSFPYRHLTKSNKTTASDYGSSPLPSRTSQTSLISTITAVEPISLVQESQMTAALKKDGGTRVDTGYGRVSLSSLLNPLTLRHQLPAPAPPPPNRSPQKHHNCSLRRLLCPACLERWRVKKPVPKENHQPLENDRRMSARKLQTILEGIDSREYHDWIRHITEINERSLEDAGVKALKPTRVTPVAAKSATVDEEESILRYALRHMSNAQRIMVGLHVARVKSRSINLEGVDAKDRFPLATLLAPVLSQASIQALTARRDLERATHGLKVGVKRPPPSTVEEQSTVNGPITNLNLERIRQEIAERETQKRLEKFLQEPAP